MVSLMASRNPVILVDPHWRRMEELFSARARERLEGFGTVLWARDDKMDEEAVTSALPDCDFVIQAMPAFDEKRLAVAGRLKAIIEVSGSFPQSVDYAACARRSVEVLCCAPGFRNAVAEMALAMALASTRGLIDEHEAFRRGQEQWLADREATDFSLFGASIGIIGFGQIGQTITRVMAPFGARIIAHDPWLDDAVARQFGVERVSLPDLLQQSRCVFIAASPTSENRAMIGADELAMMGKHTVVVLISRAHLVDFDALTDAVAKGHVRAAIDVFPDEPLADDHPIRSLQGVVLSPHRAAAVPGGRQLIGDLIVEDIAAVLDGRKPSTLQRAAAMPVHLLTGTNDAAKVGKLMR